MRVATTFVCAALATVLLAAGLMAQTAGGSPPVIADFQNRVTNYLDQRKKVAGSSPRSTDSPSKLAESQKQIADKIRVSRAGAKQGDIFTPQIAEYFRHQIAQTLNGPQGKKIRTSLRSAEPVNGYKVAVNETYPSGLPLQSTPPTLLLNLPVLPKELEYRIVGHDLALHDVAGNIIVDYIPNAIPASK